MSATLVTEEGVEVDELKFQPHMVLDKSFAVYGPSGTGKTVCVKHLLDLIRDDVQQILVVAPTEPSNRSYANYVPAPLIHYSMSVPDPKNPKRRIVGPKGALLWLEMVLKRQAMLASTFKRANRVRPLERLFRRLSEGLITKGRKDLEQSQAVRRRAEDKVKKQFRHDQSQFRDKMEVIEDLHDKMRCVIYKKYIWRELGALWDMREKLPDEETWCLQYLDLNPRLVLVFDDCAAQLKCLFAKDEFRQLFYQNRHLSLTVIFCLQDDTDLPTNLRKNAFVSIFTEPVVCTANFDRRSNNFSKHARDTVKEIIPLIYTPKHPRRKMAYIRNDERGRNFYHFTAPPPENKMFCSDAVVELCTAVQGDENRMDEENPFYDRFRIAPSTMAAG